VLKYSSHSSNSFDKKALEMASRFKVMFVNGLVLLLSCLLGFGSYFCYDSPAALQGELMESLNLTHSEYMGLYSWYSWPNVFLCFVGGYLIDAVLGRRRGGILFSFFVLIGQAILAWGVTIKSLGLMHLGRLVFGLGGETLAVVGNAYSVAWFSGKMLNLAFGLVLSVSRLGSTASLNALAPIFQSLNQTNPDTPEYVVLGDTLFIAGFTCIGSFLIAVMLAGLDLRYKTPRRDAIMEEEEESFLESVGPEINGVISQVIGDEMPLEVNDGSESFGKKLLRYYDDALGVLDFPVGAWLIFAICVFYYSSVFPLISQGVAFFVDWYDVTPAEARAINSVVYTISLPASPIFGILIDRTKHNAVWVCAAILITSLAHALMAAVRFVALTPWIPMVLIGIGYSMLACSLWPMVSFVVPHNKLGTAYGFMQAIQNLGLALTAMLSGIIVDNGGYDELLWFFLSCQGIALLCILALWRRYGPHGEPEVRRLQEHE